MITISNALSLREDLIPKNEFSRSGRSCTPLGAVVHWVENPGQEPDGVLQYFKDRALGKTGYGSAHIILGLHGDGICSIPFLPGIAEEAFHVGDSWPHYADDILRKYGPNPNRTMIGIECCHPDWSGRLAIEALHSLHDTLLFLCKLYRWPPLSSIHTHTGITHKGQPEQGGISGQTCPKWFIEHPEDFDALKAWILFDMNKEDDDGK